jgi:hypothetical protein
MGGGGDGGAADIRADENARNAKTKATTDQINAQFDGAPASKRGTGAATTDFIPGQTYYDASGNASVPLTKDPMTQQDYLMKNNPTQRTPLYSGVEDVAATPGFDDAYFKSVADAYLAYQKPQLDQQIAVARRALPSRFASTASSAYQTQAANLERDYTRNVADLSDKALDFANTQRSAVEGNRSDLIGLANSGTDSSSLASQTSARIAALSKPPAYSPLADMFAKYANTAGNYAQANVYGQMFQQNPLSYAPSGGSVHTVTNR